MYHDVLDGPNLVSCIIDGPNLIAFLIVDLWVAALVDDGTQFFRPLAGCFKRPHRTLSNSDEALTSVNTIDENERFLAVSVDADAEAGRFIVPNQIRSRLIFRE